MVESNYPSACSVTNQHDLPLSPGAQQSAQFEWHQLEGMRVGNKVLPKAVWLSRVSKQLSWVLRHRASDFRLSIRPDGSVPLNEVLSLPVFRKLQVTGFHVQEIVNDNQKQRFFMWIENGVVRIRANQGHSIPGIEDAFLLREVVEPVDVCCHGTYFEHWEAIKLRGLLHMGRNHIHFTPWDPIEAELPQCVGLRPNVEVFVYVNMAKAMALGVRFFYSANGFVLTRGDNSGAIPPYLFQKVVAINGKVLLDNRTRGHSDKGSLPGSPRERRSSSTVSSVPIEKSLSYVPTIESVFVPTDDKVLRTTLVTRGKTDPDDTSTTASTSPTHRIDRGKRSSSSADWSTSDYSVWYDDSYGYEYGTWFAFP